MHVCVCVCFPTWYVSVSNSPLVDTTTPQHNQLREKISPPHFTFWLKMLTIHFSRHKLFTTFSDHRATTQNSLLSATSALCVSSSFRSLYTKTIASISLLNYPTTRNARMKYKFHILLDISSPSLKEQPDESTLFIMKTRRMLGGDMTIIIQKISKTFFSPKVQVSFIFVKKAHKHL